VFNASIRRPPSTSSCSSDDTVADDTASGVGQTSNEQQVSANRLVLS
jgi:hypothetical protein